LTVPFSLPLSSQQLSFPEVFQDILSDWLMIFPVVQRRL